MSYTSGSCVEVADLAEAVVAGSRSPCDGAPPFTLAEWDAFVGGVRGGEFDEVAPIWPSRWRWSEHSRRWRKSADSGNWLKAAGAGPVMFLTAAPMSWGQMINGVQHAAAGGGGGISGWVTLVIGIVIGAFGILTPIAIAYWQRIIQLRDRSADREEQIALREQQKKIAQRDVWRADYDAIHGLLESCEELAYHVRRTGPLTASGLEAQRVASLRMNSERLAERGVPGLREPLLLLADSLDRIVQYGTAIEDTQSKISAQASPPEPDRLHDIMHDAILQDQAEREMTVRIVAAWKALRSEWGSI